VETITALTRNSIIDKASRVDSEGSFPALTIDALKKSGLMGLISSEEFGGMGQGLKEASEVCETLAESCGSTAMITCMHYCATAVIEKFGDSSTRKEIARGEHLSTLAFSEAGSRSHFWAPLGTARAEGESVVLDASKSWITSAHHADSYVWSSQPLSGQTGSSIFLVPAKSDGITLKGPYTGLGLRGNDSCPALAESVKIPKANILGDDGAGFDIMMGTVLPLFSVLNASISIGIMNAALKEAIAHVSGTSLDHLDQSLSSLPTIRSYLAQAKIKMDAAIALRNDTIDAILTGRKDTMLCVLKVKACAGETALEVCDIVMRVCGGAAFRKELGVERNFRDARASFIMAPTSDVLYDFIGKAICGIDLF
jgi:alkylation response protein AidB-like acyl-CoA dehydrogenase